MNANFLMLFIVIISAAYLSFQKDEKNLISTEIISLNNITRFEGIKNEIYAFYFALTENETRENIIIYTDNNVNTKVVEVQKDEKNYTIDKSIITYGNIYKNQNLFYINTTDAFSKNVSGYYFLISDTKINFTIFVVDLEFEKKRKIFQNFYKERTEKLVYQRYEDFIPYASDFRETAPLVPHCDINHYEKYDEKYIHIFDKHYETIDTAVEVINFKDDKFIALNAKDPVIVQGPYEIICYDFTEEHESQEYFFSFYSVFNEYDIKCQNHNNEKVKEGDFIQIYLEVGEEITLNFDDMEEKNFNLEIGLKLNETKKRTDEEIMSIEFIDDKNNIIILNQNETKSYLIWNKEEKNNIKIKNTGKLSCLIFVKIRVPKDKLVVYKEPVFDMIPLKPDILYAFRIPTETWEFNITDDIGYTQMMGAQLSLLIEEKIDNFSIYRDISATEYIAYPPNYTYKSVNSFYKRNAYNSLELIFNSTIDENYFIYFIYHGNKNQKIFVDYKLSFYLEMKDKIKFLDSNYNILSYIENSSPVLIQIIKKSQKNESLLYLDNNINYGNPYEALNSYLFTDNTNLMIEFKKTQESIFLFYQAEKPSDYYYNPISDNLIRGKLIKQENINEFDYIFDFKPLENSGAAEYYVYLFNSNYNYADLTNYYYLYEEIFDKYQWNAKYEITSANGAFPENASKNFVLHIGDKENFEYYVAIIARQSDSYRAFKFYPAVKLLKNVEEENKEINLDKEIYEKTKTFDFVLNKNKKLSLLINNKEKYANGKLLIQWQNDSPTKFSQLTIFKGIEDNSTAIANIISNETFFYSLKISEVDEKFKISYTLNDVEEKKVKIHLFYIPNTGRKAYADTEVNFNYISTSILPYFINPEKTNGKFEIFRLKYNEDRIKAINIRTDFYDANGKINGSNYLDIFDIKKFDEEDYKFIQIKNENKGLISKIYLEIELILKKDLEINDKLEVFTIKRIESYIIDNFSLNKFNEYQISIEANSDHKFYLANFTQNLNNDKNALISYTSLLQKTNSKLYNGNFFNPNLIPDTIDNSINIFDLNENGFITFVAYNKGKTEKGFISLSLRELNKYENIPEKNRNITYNQELIFNKRGKGNHYYIINNSNNNDGQKSITFKSSLNDAKLFDIKFYYLNDISKFNEFRLIEENLEKKSLKMGENNIDSGKIEIFGYSYNIDEKVDKEVVVSIYTDVAKKEDSQNSQKDNRTALYIILICLCSIIVLVIIIFVILKLKKKTSTEIEGIESGTEEPILESQN